MLPGLKASQSQQQETNFARDDGSALSPVAQETTLAELRQGRDNLQAELTERTGQLKALVKENFNHFISCKTTIDDIHTRLGQAERGGGAGGNASYVSTTDVVDTVREASAASPSCAFLGKRQ